MLLQIKIIIYYKSIFHDKSSNTNLVLSILVFLYILMVKHKNV